MRAAAAHQRACRGGGRAGAVHVPSAHASGSQVHIAHGAAPCAASSEEVHRAAPAYMALKAPGPSCMAATIAPRRTQGAASSVPTTGVLRTDGLELLLCGCVHCPPIGSDKTGQICCQPLQEWTLRPCSCLTQQLHSVPPSAFADTPTNNQPSTGKPWAPPQWLVAPGSQ